MRAGAAVLTLVLLAGACKQEQPAIVVDSTSIRVTNRTGAVWTDVEIWLNDHYRVTRQRMASGEALHVPLGTFVAGFGQRFDIRRQSVFSIEVTASSVDGPVTLVWGKPRRKA